MKTKALSVLLAAATTAVMLSACSAQGQAPAAAAPAAEETAEAAEETAAPAAEEAAEAAEAEETAEAPVYEGEPDEINMSYYQLFAVEPEDFQRVEDAINAITVPEIGVNVHITPIDTGNWNSQISLRLAAGDQLDLVPTFFGGPTSFSNMFASGQLMELNDLLDEYGQGIRDLLPPQYLEATTFDGITYAVPIYRDNASSVYFTARTDVLEELGLTEQFNNIRSTDDLEEIFKAVQEGTDLVPLGGQQSQGIMAQSLLYGSFEDGVYMDKYVADFIGTLTSDPTKVVNLYETEEFAKVAELAHDWYEKGYVYKDLANDDTLVNTELVKNGKCFGFAFNAESSTVQATLTPCGYEMSVVKLGESPIKTSAVNMITWVIPSTSQEPEAAMRFMNMMYTDERIINLLNWGEEGIDYVVQDDGTFNYPEGMDAANHKYHMEITWLFGNQYACGVWNDDPDLRKNALEINRNASFSDNFGFIADSTGLDTQIAGMNSAVNEYVAGLICGVTDPETTIPDMISKMKAAGSDELVSAVQEQLDAWRAEQGK